MKFFIDTNILIQFFLKRAGWLENTLNSLMGYDKLFVHYHSILEMKYVFKKSKYFKKLSDEWKNKILEESIFDVDFGHDVLKQKMNSIKYCRDPDDDFLINFAIQNRYDGILTYDKDLLVLNNQCINLKILKPEERIDEIINNTIA